MFLVQVLEAQKQRAREKYCIMPQASPYTYDKVSFFITDVELINLCIRDAVHLQHSGIICYYILYSFHRVVICGVLVSSSTSCYVAIHHFTLKYQVSK